jgi:hypothetical protein
MNPHVILRGPSGKIYLKRWWIISPNAKWGFNMYLHNFLSSDEDRALHDHPWWNISIILYGTYFEHMPKNIENWKNGNREKIVKKRYPFIPVYRSAETIHRIELLKNPDGTEKNVWTLFITGPKVRDWGFWCPFGFRHNNKFLDPSGLKTGPGCD